jgi:predicted acetyltransferase
MGVDVQVTEAGHDEQARLAGLFELYIYDFSEILGLDVEEDGRFELPALAPYWTAPGHRPFLIRVDARLAGFALVQERSRLTGHEGVRDMAEFFVMRRYRRRGVGARAAGLLFDRFRGPWEVRQRPENHDATAFWRRAVAHYTAGRFDDSMWNDERWRGPVQRFDSAK